MRTAILSVVAVFASSAVAVNCAKGLHIIVGRGTGEPDGFGETGELAKNITAVIPGSDMVAVDYPASAVDPNYEISENEGAAAVYRMVTEYHKDCAGSKMAYLGWSQGAQIAVNAFCGGQGGIFDYATPIPADAVEDVVAIAIFGDPSHNITAPWNRGNATYDGLFPRNSTGACSEFTEKIASYCDQGDVYCAQGSNRSVHGLYLVRDGDEMKTFVVNQYTAAIEGANGTSASPSIFPTASKTAEPSATSTNKHNSAAGISAGLVYAVPAALFAAAHILS